MSNIELLVIGLLIIFALVVVVVFRERRWQGALGWIMIGGAFIVSLLRTREATLVDTVLAALVIVLGMALAGYDFVRFERPRRRQRKAAGEPPGIYFIRRPRIRLRRKRAHNQREG